MAVVHVDDKNFVKEVVKSKTLVIADFWADWCGPCRMMGPVFEELSSSYKNKIKFVKINVDENRSLSEKYGIQGIPALLIFKDGEETDRFVGFMAKEVLKSKIDGVLK